VRAAGTTAHALGSSSPLPGTFKALLAGRTRCHMAPSREHNAVFGYSAVAQRVLDFSIGKMILIHC
jgi:hypothetical protein